MKRFLCIVSAIAVLLSTTTVYAQPVETDSQTEQTFTKVTGAASYAASVETQSADGRFTYLVYPSTKTAALKRCNDITSKSITVPETIEYEGSVYTITEIYGDTYAKGAFEENNLMVHITLPDTVKKIGAKAFKHCESLTDFVLPKYIEQIDYSAFELCDSLKSIFIPKTLKTASNWTNGPFANCQNLKTVTFEDGIDKIPDNLFSKCSGLEKIDIPNGITTIGAHAFYNCANLKTVNFPDSVTFIDNSAFESCPNLTDVRLPSKLQQLNDRAFGSCPSIKSIVIPKSLQKVNVGSSIVGPFTGCENLKTVTFETGTTKITDNLFINCPGIETINIPDSITEIGTRAFANCGNLANIVITDKSRLKTIDGFAFENCIKLITLNLPCKYLETIGGGAFQGCTALKTVSFPNSLKTIGERAFNSCEKLTNVVLPEKLTELKLFAFCRCYALTKITVPAGVKEIGQSAFEDCTNLVEVTLKGVETLDFAGSQFKGCISLKKVNLPNTLTTLYSNTFENCSSLETIVIPNSVTTIGNNSFRGCTSLANVTLSKSLTKIPMGMFENCDSLVDISIPDSVTEIGRKAFNTPYLEHVRFGLNTNIATIADDAFSPTTDYLTIHGPERAYAQEYAEAHDITYVADAQIEPEPAGSSKIKVEISTGTNSKVDTTLLPINVKDKIGNDINKTISVDSDGNINISGLDDDTYQFEFNAQNCAPRIYIVIVSNGDIDLKSIKLNLYGDVNGDGSITLGDVLKANAAARNSKPLTGYEKDVADINGDGNISLGDVLKMNAHARNSKFLW